MLATLSCLPPWTDTAVHLFSPASPNSRGLDPKQGQVRERLCWPNCSETRHQQHFPTHAPPSVETFEISDHFCILEAIHLPSSFRKQSAAIVFVPLLLPDCIKEAPSAILGAKVRQQLVPSVTLLMQTYHVLHVLASFLRAVPHFKL